MNPITVKISNPPEPMLEQAIRHRAYELYLQRGMAHGHDVDDWLQAEAELVHGHSTARSELTLSELNEFEQAGDRMWCCGESFCEWSGDYHIMTECQKRPVQNERFPSRVPARDRTG